MFYDVIVKNKDNSYTVDVFLIDVNCFVTSVKISKSTIFVYLS